MTNSNYLSIHSTFFEILKPVNQVFVVGHSFGEVDLPYFKKVINSIQENAVWNIYYYNEDEADAFKDKISSVGVRPEQVKMRSSN